MTILQRTASVFFALFFSLSTGYASGLAQTIQINTFLHGFVGKPSWLLIVRDVDNGLTIPYEYPVERGTNYWIASTNSENYLITSSVMRFTTYNSYSNRYVESTIPNFCGLESMGRIIRGKSFSITITGMLSPDPHTYQCQVSRY